MLFNIHLIIPGYFGERRSTLTLFSSINGDIIEKSKKLKF